MEFKPNYRNYLQQGILLFNNVMIMMSICLVIFGVLIFILVLYILLELHYFIRSCICVLSACICKKKVNILDETTVAGFCVTTDIDNLLTHMNNARFIRELDFAKIDFYERTGLYKEIKNNGGELALGATTIRYRRFIKLFSRYVITTRIIYWDEKSIYMEHKFISPTDNFINAIVLCKTRLTNCNAENVIGGLITNSHSNNEQYNKPEKPEMTMELQKWIEYNEISSATLRFNNN